MYKHFNLLIVSRIFRKKTSFILKLNIKETRTATTAENWMRFESGLLTNK